MDTACYFPSKGAIISRDRNTIVPMTELYLSSLQSPSRWLVVMGVSGCGKSSLGAALARELGLPLIEGDDFHPPESVSKMRAGIALTDADRAGWLDTLAATLAAHPQGAVLSCSALKRGYRDRLRAAVPRLLFVFMELSREEAERRVAGRGRRPSAASPDAGPGTSSPRAWWPTSSRPSNRRSERPTCWRSMRRRRCPNWWTGFGPGCAKHHEGRRRGA
jgi:gluconokinase